MLIIPYICHDSRSATGCHRVPQGQLSYPFMIFRFRGSLLPMKSRILGAIALRGSKLAPALS